MPDAEEPKGSDNSEKVSKAEDSATSANGSSSKQRSVSFNRDVHVKRIAPNRAAPAAPAGDGVRRQPLAGLSRQELAQEAAKVLAQASSVHCSSTSPPEKFFSLPTRRRHKPETLSQNAPIRRRSEELGVTTDLVPPKALRTSLNRSTSDVTSKKHRRTNNTVFNLFKRPDKDLSYSTHDQIVQPKKESAPVKRSKSDVSDLKSSSLRQIRKRTGSESEEYLNSVIGKKSQLSPIIESAHSDDYFKAKDAKVLAAEGTEVAEDRSPEYKINPIEKPPRTKEPKAPVRPRRAKTLEHLKPVKLTIQHFDTLPKNKTNQKRLLVDEIDAPRSVKKTISEFQKSAEMIHSSQLPPEKLPLTKGHAVDSMVKILNQDKYLPPPKATLIVPPSTAAHNNNQPFSYTKPSNVSPDPNLYARSLSPERPPSPINRSGIIYAQVVCGENGKGGPKQTIHTSISPERRLAHNSDEDEGLGYENQFRNSIDFSYDINRYHAEETGDVIDSPITPRFKEYKNHKFIDDDITYQNHSALETDLRGRGDGMDAKRRESIIESHERSYDKKIAELSHRRELLENRFNARLRRDHNSSTRFSPEKESSDQAETKDVRDYVRETAETNKSENIKSKYVATFDTAVEIDRREFIDRRLAEEPREINYFNQSSPRYFPPEPEYEPPSLDSQTSGPKYSPERKYKPRAARSSSQEGLISSKYSSKHRQEFSDSRDHYASNPEISQKRSEISEDREEYDPSRPETFHNSLQRQRHNNSDRHYRIQDEYLEQSSSRSLRQQASEGRRDYGEENSGPESSKGRYDHDRDRDNKFADSGIENDFRKDSNGDIHSRGVVSPASREMPTRRVKGDLRNESEDEGFASSLLIASERQHTEDNCTLVKSRYESEYRRNASRRDEFVHRERSIDDGSFYDPRIDKFEDRSAQQNINAKPPKPSKKFSGLEKVKQLFSRDSSKKSKKDKDKKIDVERPYSRTDGHGMVRVEDLRRRYTEYKGSTEDLDIGLEPRKGRTSRSSDMDSSLEHRRGRTSRSSDLEVSSRAGMHSRTSKNRDDDGSSTMEYDYSQRRRMATPSPSPSPPRRTSREIESSKHDSRRQQTVSNGWFKSIDRLSKNKSKQSKLDKDSMITTEDDTSIRKKSYSSNGKQPAKNLRFFGDTDLESNDSVSKHHSILRKRSNISELKNDGSKSLNRNKKTLSNSVHGLDRTDYADNKYKSSSLTNLQGTLDSRQNLLANSYNKEKYNSSRRDLHNISEIHSNSETESQFEERERERDYLNDNGTLKGNRKPPMSPLREKRRSKSQTKSITRNGYHGSRGDLNDEPKVNLSDLHTSKSDIRGSRQELSGSRNELRSRRRRMPASATSPGDSSTEGDSSHQSQKSIVYLHAATVGDIPSTGRISRGRSRDDVSSVNSSLRPQTKTVARSFSVLAPWKPRHYREPYDINYSQSGHQSTIKRAEKSSRTATLKKEPTLSSNKSKSTSTKNLSTSKYDRSSEERTLQNKSNTSTLSRLYKKDDESKKATTNGSLFGRSGKGSSKENINSYQQSSTMTRSRNDLRDKNKKSMSIEVLNRDSPPKGTKRTSVERERISRSISMPKDPNKTAGWFKITKKSKKVEGSSRMY